MSILGAKPTSKYTSIHSKQPFQRKTTALILVWMVLRMLNSTELDDIIKDPRIASEYSDSEEQGRRAAWDTISETSMSISWFDWKPPYWILYKQAICRNDVQGNVIRYCSTMHFHPHLNQLEWFKTDTEKSRAKFTPTICQNHWCLNGGYPLVI